MNSVQHPGSSVPWFGARKMARELQAEVNRLRGQLADARRQLDTFGVLPIAELQALRASLESELKSRRMVIAKEQADAEAALSSAKEQLAQVRQSVVVTEDIAFLQEAGVYKYRHPLTDVIAYERQLKEIEDCIKAAIRKDGGAVLATTNWTVNNSAAAGRAMVRDFSKLMLRAFNAEADNLVRGLKPYKLDGAIERLTKVADTIAKLGKTMDIRISPPYLRLRLNELERFTY